MARHCIAPNNPPSFWSKYYGVVGAVDGTVLECVTGASPLTDDDKLVMPEYQITFDAYRTTILELIYTGLDTLTTNEHIGEVV